MFLGVGYQRLRVCAERLVEVRQDQFCDPSLGGDTSGVAG